MLRDAKMNYAIMEKQAYALVKSLKQFRTYIGYSPVLAYIPFPAVKDVLTQHDGLGARRKWISKVHEYDIDIRPTKTIKGHGLANLMTSQGEQPDVYFIDEQHEWYKDTIYYHKNLWLQLLKIILLMRIELCDNLTGNIMLSLLHKKLKKR